jgi:hypothetical protein
MQRSNHDILVDPATEDRESLDGIVNTRLASLLDDAPSVARSLLDGEVENRIDALAVIKNVSAITAKAIRDHNEPLFTQGIETLEAIWRVGNPDAMLPVTTPAREASLWESITLELYALGGLLVRYERWHHLPSLVLRRPDPESHDGPGFAKVRSRARAPRPIPTTPRSSSARSV